MKVEIFKSSAHGNVSAPPSKSYAHRLILAAFLTNKRCQISNVELSQDILATLRCIKALGGNYTYENDTLTLEGKYDLIGSDTYELDCGESGSTMRFIIPVALVLKKNKTIIIKGTERLISRGIKSYEALFKANNISYKINSDSVEIKGSLKKDKFVVDGSISSQFITGLLFALPMYRKDSIIEITGEIVSEPYIRITVDVLKQFGINVTMEKNIITIMGHQKYRRCNTVVEGDYSNAAFLEALKYFDKDNTVSVKGLNYLTIQGDSVYRKLFPMLENHDCEIDISNCIDLGPILFTLASYLNGAKITGIKRLKIKESDRVDDVVQELKKFGALIDVYDDYVIIHKTELHKPDAELDGHNDHRIVMSMSVLLTAFGGVINGCEAINKSFPTFFDRLKEVGVKYELK